MSANFHKQGSGVLFIQNKKLPIKHPLQLNLVMLLLLCAGITTHAQSLNWQLTQTLSDMDADYVPKISSAMFAGTFNKPQPNPAAPLRRLTTDYRKITWKERYRLYHFENKKSENRNLQPILKKQHKRIH